MRVEYCKEENLNSINKDYLREARKILGFSGGVSGKEPTCQFRRHKRHGFDSWIRKIPWRRKQQLTTMFLLAAKSRQSCPTLCNPIDGSPTGSSVLGILQARILEWVAISFSNAGK